MLRYAITDLSRTATTPEKRLEAMREAARRWLSSGVDFVQLREKTISAAEVLRLASDFLAVRREVGGSTRLLLNSRVDIAVAAGADGVHLTSAAGEMTAEQVRRVFAAAGMARPTVSFSCHAIEDIRRARDMSVDLILFGPVFEKVVGGMAVAEGSGLDLLAEAVRAAGDIRVLALGGVTAEKLLACSNAGASGVASVRLFAK